MTCGHPVPKSGVCALRCVARCVSAGWTQAAGLRGPLQRGKEFGDQPPHRPEESGPGGGLAGKTTQINYFALGEAAYLVDLPGYGYARVSKAERDRWGRLMESYFASGLIDLGVMIVDARHKPTADDVTMANWFFDTGCPVIVVANKLDKLKKSEVEPNLSRIRETLGLREEDLLVPFSAERGDGQEELRALLDAVIADDAE